MPIDPTLLKILVCPESKDTVSPAPEEILQTLNTLIEKQELKNKAGKLIKDKLAAGLLRSDGKRLYPVIDNIPVMLIDEGIEL